MMLSVVWFVFDLSSELERLSIVGSRCDVIRQAIRVMIGAVFVARLPVLLRLRTSQGFCNWAV